MIFNGTSVVPGFMSKIEIVPTFYNVVGITIIFSVGFTAYGVMSIITTRKATTNTI